MSSISVKEVRSYTVSVKEVVEFAVSVQELASYSVELREVSFYGHSRHLIGEITDVDEITASWVHVQLPKVVIEEVDHIEADWVNVHVVGKPALTGGDGSLLTGADGSPLTGADYDGPAVVLAEVDEAVAAPISVHVMSALLEDVGAISADWTLVQVLSASFGDVDALYWEPGLLRGADGEPLQGADGEYLTDGSLARMDKTHVRSAEIEDVDAIEAKAITITPLSAVLEEVDEVVEAQPNTVWMPKAELEDLDSIAAQLVLVQQLSATLEEVDEVTGSYVHRVVLKGVIDDVDSIEANPQQLHVLTGADGEVLTGADGEVLLGQGCA